MTKRETLKAMYESYLNKDKIDFKTFVSIIDNFNLKASEAIADGKQLRSVIGTIKVSRKARNTKKLFPDWKKSLEVKQEIINKGGVPYDKIKHSEGEMWLVFYTSPYVYKTIWNTFNTTIKNIDFYIYETYKDHRKRVSKNCTNGILELI